MPSDMLQFVQNCHYSFAWLIGLSPPLRPFTPIQLGISNGSMGSDQPTSLWFSFLQPLPNPDGLGTYKFQHMSPHICGIIVVFCHCYYLFSQPHALRNWQIPWWEKWWARSDSTPFPCLEHGGLSSCRCFGHALAPSRGCSCWLIGFINFL